MIVVLAPLLIFLVVVRVKWTDRVFNQILDRMCVKNLEEIKQDPYSTLWLDRFEALDKVGFLHAAFVFFWRHPAHNFKGTILEEFTK